MEPAFRHVFLFLLCKQSVKNYIFGRVPIVTLIIITKEYVQNCVQYFIGFGVFHTFLTGYLIITLFFFLFTWPHRIPLVKKEVNVNKYKYCYYFFISSVYYAVSKVVVVT